MKTQIAENISDPVIKFNKTHKSIQVHRDILTYEKNKTRQINGFYKFSTDNIINIFNAYTAPPQLKKKKTIYFNIFRNKDDNIFTGKKPI